MTELVNGLVEDGRYANQIELVTTVGVQMVEVRFVDCAGRRRRIALNGWREAQATARGLALDGCSAVSLRSIRRDVYVVDPETWDRELIAANVLLSEVGELSQWWCEKHPAFGLVLMPASERRPARRLRA